MIIYNSGGTKILEIEVDDNSYRYRAIKGGNSLTLYYSLSEHVEIPVGAYCHFQAEQYTLERPEAFKMKHSRLFEYTVVFESPAAKAGKWKFRNTVDGRLKFPLTAKPIEHLQMFVDNMNRRDSGWSVGSCVDGDEVLINYNHVYCDEALALIASELKTEFEYNGKTVSLRKVEYNKNNPLPLSYGRGNGFKPGVGRSNYGDKPPIEILYVQGGTDNIDPSKYGNKELLLPAGQTISYDGEYFEDESGFNSANARSYIVDEDGLSIRRNDKPLSSLEENSLDCSDIYPKRVGAVSEVIVVDAEKHFYDIKDSSIPAALDYSQCRIGGEKATIIFQSGELAGREFDLEQTDNALTGYVHAERRFKIVPAELDGQTMPGGVFVPKVGDKYAIFNISMPAAYIGDNATKTGASWDMFRVGVRHLFDNEEQKFSFSGELDGIWAKRDWVNIGGKIKLGGYVLFSDERFQQEGILVRIIGIKDYINNPHSPEIELSNSTVSGNFSTTIKQLQGEEVLVEDYHREALQFTKRRFRDAKETISMLEESLLNFSGSINPVAVQTMLLLLGDESLQFRFVNNMTNPAKVTHSITYDNETKQLTAAAGIIQHMTLGITSLSSSHTPDKYKFWSLPEYVSSVLDDGAKKYFLYAKVSKTAQTGTFILSDTAIGMEDVSGYYHLLTGVLNSEDNGERSFVTLYGFTEILPGRITTDLITSTDGKMYIDLINKIICGRIKFLSGDSETDLEDWADSVNKTRIGGVNILLNSKATKSGTAYNIGYWDSVRDFVPGEELTVTIKGNIPGSKLFGLWFNTGSLGTGSIPKLKDGYYQKKLTVPAATNTRRVGLYLIGNQSAGDNWEFEWIKLESGDKVTLEWSAPTEELKASIEETKSYAEAVMDNVSDLDIYINNAFKDGVIDAAEAKAIEKYINSVNEIMSKAEASYNKVYANTYLTGTAKTNLLNAKINLWGQRDTLLSAINTAISGGTTTPAQKTAVDNSFNSFNSLMSAFQNALEDANKAIQAKLDSIAKDYTDIKASVYAIDSTTKKFMNVAGFATTTPSITGYMIITTPILPSRMCKVSIKGYNYVSARADINLNVNFYAYTGSYPNTRFTNLGNFPITEVRLGRLASGATVIIIGTTSTVWSYPRVVVDEALIGYNAATPDSYKDGWSIQFGTDLSAYTLITDVPGTDIQARIEEAEYLKSALKQATEIVGGLILSSIIAGRDANEIVRSYLNGNPNLNPIAFAAGVENFGMTNETQKNALRHDGSGFLANKKIEWDVSGNTDYSGNLKGVSGTFKTLNCVDNNGNIVGSIKFGSDGRIWFENCSIAHQAATGAFLTSDVWVRGVFGSFGRTALVITGTSYGYVYKDGLSGGSQYVSLSSGQDSSGNTYYNIPLYSPTSESSGMPVDLVIINHGSTARYNLPYIPGKTIAMVNSRDQNSNVYIYTNGRTIQMHGGLGITLTCVGDKQYPNNSSWLGRGWQITGYNDNQWT